jgi:hypothetical protein
MAITKTNGVFSFGDGTSVGAINNGSLINSTTTAPVWMNSNANSFSNASVNTMEYAIQGQKIIADHNMSELQFLSAGETTVKEILVNKLAQSMFQGRCIEFTKMQDPVTHGYKFVARIFVVPDTQVRILREHKII